LDKRDWNYGGGNHIARGSCRKKSILLLASMEEGIGGAGIRKAASLQDRKRKTHSVRTSA